MQRLTPFLIDASRGVPDRCTNRLSYNSATYVPLRRAQTGLSSRASIYHTAIKRSRFVISLGWARTRRNYVLIISGAGERGQCRIVIVAGHYASLGDPEHHGEPAIIEKYRFLRIVARRDKFSHYCVICNPAKLIKLKARI